MKEAFCSDKYRRASWNSQFVAMLAQMSGISGIVLFCTNIFQEMREKGQLTSLPVNVAVLITLGFNLLGCFLSTYPSQKFGQKMTLIIGLVLMLISHIGVIAFKIAGFDSVVVAFLVLFLLSF